MGFFSGIAHAIEHAVSSAVHGVEGAVKDIVHIVGKVGGEVVRDSVDIIAKQVEGLTKEAVSAVMEYAVKNIDKDFVAIMSGVKLLTGQITPEDFVKNMFSAVLVGSGIGALPHATASNKAMIKEAVTTPKLNTSAAIARIKAAAAKDPHMKAQIKKNIAMMDKLKKELGVSEADVGAEDLQALEDLREYIA